MRNELSLAALIMFVVGFFIILTSVPTAGIVTFGMVLIAASMILLAILFNFFPEKKIIAVRKIGLPMPAKKKVAKKAKKKKK